MLLEYVGKEKKRVPCWKSMACWKRSLFCDYYVYLNFSQKNKKKTKKRILLHWFYSTLPRTQVYPMVGYEVQYWNNLSDYKPRLEDICILDVGSRTLVGGYQ